MAITNTSTYIDNNSSSYKTHKINAEYKKKSDTQRVAAENPLAEAFTVTFHFSISSACVFLVYSQAHLELKGFTLNTEC